MLKSLYDYAQRRELILPAGCIRKTVKAYICLSSEGKFQMVQTVNDQEVIAPDIGSLANGKDKSNIIVEKRSVILPEQEQKDENGKKVMTLLPLAQWPAKSRFFLNALHEGGQREPMLEVCARALEDPVTAAQIWEELNRKKIKGSDRITFQVSYAPVLKSQAFLDWWLVWRKQFLKPEDGEKTVCMITGQPTIPAATTAPITGLHAVGGHARGDALICFDKNAFCSYGLKKAENAPVSEEAFAGVKAALDDLLKTAPTLAGMKFVHWYDAELSEQEDPLRQIPDFFAQTGGEDEDVDDADADDDADDEEEEENPFSAEEQRLEQLQKEITAQQQANALVNSIDSGEQAVIPANVHYHILLLTGVGGRVMVRRYERGSYQELKERLDQWRQDLELVNINGTGLVKRCKLTARLMRLMKHQTSDSRPFERMSKELSGIAPAVVLAILTGGMLPDSVALRALNYIRSEIMAADEEDGLRSYTVAYAYQWLKVWLLRKRRQAGEKEDLMEKYDINHPNAAYHLGGQMAVFAAIQNAAMPDVNVGVVQRYYASAMQSPALVLGMLSRRSVHHLEKMENQALARKFMEHLQELSVAVGANPLTTLTLEQQSYFALGYYQMGAELTREKLEAIENKKKREAEQNAAQDPQQ